MLRFKPIRQQKYFFLDILQPGWVPSPLIKEGGGSYLCGAFVDEALNCFAFIKNETKPFCLYEIKLPFPIFFFFFFYVLFNNKTWLFSFQRYLNQLALLIWVLKQNPVIRSDFIHAGWNLQPVAELVHNAIHAEQGSALGILE